MVEGSTRNESVSTNEDILPESVHCINRYILLCTRRGFADATNTCPSAYCCHLQIINICINFNYSQLIYFLDEILLTSIQYTQYQL